MKPLLDTIAKSVSHERRLFHLKNFTQHIGFVYKLKNEILKLNIKVNIIFYHTKKRLFKKENIKCWNLLQMLLNFSDMCSNEGIVKVRDSTDP